MPSLLMPSHLNYTPVGDIAVVGLCLLMMMLLVQNYIHKSKSFRLMLIMLCTTCFAAVTSLLFKMNVDLPGTMPVYGFRIIHYVLLALNVFFYLYYLQEPLFISEKSAKIFNLSSMILLALAVAADIAGTVFRFGYYVDENGEHFGFNAFRLVYVLFSAVMLFTIVRYRSRIIRPIYLGLLGSNVLSISIFLLQLLFAQVSFSGVANFLLVLGIIYIFHSNPYDVNTGAVSENYFYEELNENLEKKQTMVLISYNVMNLSKVMSSSKEMKSEFNHFFHRNVTGGILYRLPGDRLILAFPKRYDLAQDREIEQLLEQFKSNHSKFQLDYKIVIVETTPDVSQGEEYVHLIEFVEQSIPNNTIHTIRESDIQSFYKNSYILSELEDISQKKDLDDPRILVYCQPVYNILSGKYDTAEALMRMKLEKTGMVFPDQFIPLAEQHGLIHTISLIILNKTCGAIRSLLEENYSIERISVNFSTLDIRYDAFCLEVQQIIARNQIPYEKIAIEITESRSESDFNLMKAKVIELQKLGIKFYLDDFGTGYSNFERIMEIPFDIIKFDRSMLLESAKSESSYFMVSTFATMFSKLEYSVLFEGIENDNDEANCVQMSAKYLQGYKYSKPIPIEKLCNFLEKEIVVN